VGGGGGGGSEWGGGGWRGTGLRPNGCGGGVLRLGGRARGGVSARVAASGDGGTVLLLALVNRLPIRAPPQ